jgi:hypothetical protein
VSEVGGPYYDNCPGPELQTPGGHSAILHQVTRQA